MEYQQLYVTCPYCLQSNMVDVRGAADEWIAECGNKACEAAFIVEYQTSTAATTSKTTKVIKIHGKRLKESV